MADESPVIESKSWTSRNDRSTGHSTPQQTASSISVEPQLLLERILTLEIVSPSAQPSREAGGAVKEAK